METLTINDAEKAFELWNNDHRSNPNDFLSEDECKLLKSGSLAQKQAACLISYVRSLKGQS